MIKKLLVVLALLPIAFIIAALSHHHLVKTSDYNYTRFAASQYQHGTFSGPTAGETALEFELYDTNGKLHTLADYLGSYVVIETGSLTCPQYISRIPAMNELASQHEDIVFLTLYVREAHPGSAIPQHSESQHKQQLARRLINEEPEQRTVLVDALEGGTHQSYGSWPNMVYVIAPDGAVAFRGMWNNPEVVGEILERIQAGKSLDGIDPGLTASFDSASRVLDRAGGHAKLDFVFGVFTSVLGHIRHGVGPTDKDG